jgi:hypothetical protein
MIDHAILWDLLALRIVHGPDDLVDIPNVEFFAGCNHTRGHISRC